MLPWPCGLYHGQGFPNQSPTFSRWMEHLKLVALWPRSNCSSWCWKRTAPSWLDPGSPHHHSPSSGRQSHSWAGSHHPGDNPALSPSPPSPLCPSPALLCPSCLPTVDVVLTPGTVCAHRRVWCAACSWHQQAVMAQSCSPAAKSQKKNNLPVAVQAWGQPLLRHRPPVCRPPPLKPPPQAAARHDALQPLCQASLCALPLEIKPGATHSLCLLG